MTQDTSTTRLTRRGALAALGATAATVAVAACGPIGTPGGGPAPQAGAPRHGGTLRYASSTDLANLEVHERNQRSIDMKYQTVDNLVYLDPDTFKPTPWLAESWEFSADNKQLKLNLRKGVTYHSGRDFGSEDVRYNVLRARDPKLTNITTQFLTLSSWIKDMALPDKNTIVLTFDKARVGIFDMFDDWNMLDREILEDPKRAQTTIGGTGPFKFIQWTPAVSARWERNPNWWAAGTEKKPYLDAVDVGMYADVQAMTVALESGAIDVITIPALRDAARLRDNPGYRLVSNSKSGQVHTANINHFKPPTNNKAVRQAMQLALDRKRCVENVMLGLGHVATLPWTPGTLAYDADRDKRYDYNLDKAAALLKDAPADVKNTPIVMMIDSQRPDSLQFGQIWKADLEKIGLKVDLQSVQGQTITDATRKQNVYNVSIAGSAWANLEGAIYLYLGNRPWPVPPGTPGGPPLPTNTNFYNQKYFDLAEQASGEFDTVKRKAIYGQISDLLLDEVNGLIVAHRFPNWLSTSKVNGARFATTERVRWADVWLSE